LVARILIYIYIYIYEVSCTICVCRPACRDDDDGASAAAFVVARNDVNTATDLLMCLAEPMFFRVSYVLATHYREWWISLLEHLVFRPKTSMEILEHFTESWDHHHVLLHAMDYGQDQNRQEASTRMSVSAYFEMIFAPFQDRSYSLQAHMLDRKEEFAKQCVLLIVQDLFGT
jgi:hypothetical protein